jgi:hypothetical protein
MTKEWELGYPQYQIAPASSSISDHYPIILENMDTKHFHGFRFEACWTGLPWFR